MWGSGSGSGPLGGLQGLFQPLQRNSAGSGRGEEAAAQPSASSSLPEAFDDSRTSTRRVKVRKVRGPGGPQGEEFASQAERRIAEIVPGLADLSISASAMEGPMRTARDIRIEKLRQQQSTIDEIRELEDIYDMAKPNPVDEEPRPEGWEPKERPTPRSIRLSPYEYEMINYQRMLMRKNIWYYRDRMSVPRGPCPLHVLKEAWTSGVIDENTMVWGHGLFDWLPIKNVKLLVPMIRTPEVRFATWVKRTFSLKPSLERIREARRTIRTSEVQSQQVERMR